MEYKVIKLNDNLFESNIKLTLKEYCIVKEHICTTQHNHTHCDCRLMIQAAEIVMREGIICLSTVFKTVFPLVTYHPYNARRRLLKLPLVAFRLSKELYLMEKVAGFDYNSLMDFLNSKVNVQNSPGMTKDELRSLLSFVKGESAFVMLFISVLISLLLKRGLTLG